MTIVCRCELLIPIVLWRGRQTSLANAVAFFATEFGIGAEAGGLVGFAKGIEIRVVGGVPGFSAGSFGGAVVPEEEFLVVLLAFGAVAGESGFVGGRRRRRRRRRDVPSRKGLGRGRGMPGIDVALLGRWLVDAEVRSVLVTCPLSPYR
jgi:hypothetical protein